MNHFGSQWAEQHVQGSLSTYSGCIHSGSQWAEQHVQGSLSTYSGCIGGQ